MIELRENEKILIKLHRHWIVIVEKFIFSLVLFMVPVFFIFVETPALNFISSEIFTSLTFFITTIYWLLVAAFFLKVWVEYWLDVWIITDKRIIDIEQVSLFHRKVSEISLSRVQDVTVSIPNMLATFLGFGNITVQTAGEQDFSINQISDIHRARKLILSGNANSLKKR